MKALVIYYSRTGNTRFVAEQIAKDAKADIEEIVDEQDRSGIFGWLKSGRDAVQKKETAIKKLKTDPKKYDKIFIGQPVWASTVNPAIRTFIDKYDMSGKKIVLFCTMNGHSEGKCMDNTAAILPNCEVIGKRSFRKPLKSKELAKENIKAFVGSLGTSPKPGQ